MPDDEDICICGHKFEDHDWQGSGDEDETPGWACLIYPCKCKFFREGGFE